MFCLGLIIGAVAGVMCLLVLIGGAFVIPQFQVVHVFFVTIGIVFCEISFILRDSKASVTIQEMAPGGASKPQNWQ